MPISKFPLISYRLVEGKHRHNRPFVYYDDARMTASRMYGRSRVPIKIIRKVQEGPTVAIKEFLADTVRTPAEQRGMGF